VFCLDVLIVLLCLLDSTALPAPENTQAPLLGEHTEEILKQLGYDQHSIEALKESGAI